MPHKLTSEESLNSIKEYISTLDDMAYSITALQWSIEPIKLQLLGEAGDKISEAVKLLKQALDAPEKREVKY